MKTLELSVDEQDNPIFFSAAGGDPVSLAEAKEEVFQALDTFPPIANELLTLISQGKIDGNHYIGECACLKGTIARLHLDRGWCPTCAYSAIHDVTQHTQVVYDVLEDHGVPCALELPAEELFMHIDIGDTPETNQACAIVADWIKEWQKVRTTLIEELCPF